MADESTWILVVTALAGCAAVVQHFYDRYAENGLYKRTERRTREIPAQIGIEVENALNRVALAQRAEIEAEVKSAEMSMVRSVGIDKQAHAMVARGLSEAILGPALPILRQFAPGLADTLEDNPQLVEVLIQNPLFKKYIEPRLAQFLGKKDEGGGDNPFLKGLNP